MKLTLAAIACFFLAVAGSFIWFVATWDRDAEQQVGQITQQQKDRLA
ncbi:hypothetical protein M8745_13765 [Lutimaribacter sp. EGI FJ00014]|nr:hypothetical protein [Lutimaribacter sp. EGI FJ00014]